MYWTLIAIGLFIFGLIGIIAFDVEYLDMELMLALSWISGIVGGVATAIMVLTIIMNHIGIEKAIYDKQMDRASLVKRLEIVDSDYEDISKSEVYKETYEWNKDVYSHKYWGSNPWTNWFYDKDYCDALEYINLEEK